MQKRDGNESETGGAPGSGQSRARGKARRRARREAADGESEPAPAKVRAAKPRKGPVLLLIGTRKGAFFLKSDGDREKWKLRGPELYGQIVNHVVLDPRDGETMLFATRPGHLGPTIMRSTDGGKTLQEARLPPAFAQGRGALRPRTVGHVFWLQPGHASEPGVWYAGSSPQGLFRSEDGGQSWSDVLGFNAHPRLDDWTGGEKDAPPDGATLHSIQIDPRDPRHLYLGMSAGGVFESADRGESWTALNRGLEADFIPGPPPEFGHDPHCMGVHPARPDRLWQQNHCGIYRMDRPEGAWVRVGRNMPGKIGDIGFPIVLHPRDPDTAWVFPMDGTTVWPRTSPGGRPAVYRTRDAGASWQRQDAGLPREQGWFTVKRQCMAQDARSKVGLYFGTTQGEIWGSTNEGKRWRCLVRHLPHVYSVEVAGVSR